MKKLSLLIIAVVLFSGLSAKPVDVAVAQRLGAKFMLAGNRVESASMSLVSVGKTDSGTNAYYIFNCQPKGFVIVAADDRMYPILAYSTEGKFDLVAAEEGPKVFLDAYCEDLETAIADNLTQSQDIENQWRMLKENGALSSCGDREKVGPLCTSTWHQTQLYNDQCPIDLEGYHGHVKVGCVANAMAQIMRYWEWPKTGVGEHSYYCWGYGNTSYGTLSANFGEADYRYELMPDFLDYTSQKYEIDAIALLEYHAGVSVEMNYGPNASGAYSGDVLPAMKQHFRYSYSASFEDRDDYTDQEWTNMMRNEIDNGRPMYYSAYSYTKDGTRGGHAFVCDGYDMLDFFHFNWGWQGFDNGFYHINGMDLTHHAYNYNHSASMNLQPNEEYFNQPEQVNSFIWTTEQGTGVRLRLRVPDVTLGGEPITEVDSVVVLMNGEPFHTFLSPNPAAILLFEDILDDADAGSVNYFTIYSVTSGGRSKGVTIPVKMWESDGCVCTPLTFRLFDACGDGWLSPAISILDERGIVLYRVGLDSGYTDTLTVDIPINRTLTLYWNYCNIGYEDDDEECSFEVYDYEDEMIFGLDSKPTVGELFSFYNDYPLAVEPVFITEEDYVSVTVFDVFGRLVYTGNVDSFNVNSLKNGVFMLQYVTSDGRSRTFKISR